MDTVKDYTQLIVEESDEDEDEPKADDAAEAEPVQEGDGTPEDPTTSNDKAEASKSKDKSRGTPAAAQQEPPKKAGKKGKEVVAAPVEVEDPNKKPDPNVNKVIPSIVHLKRESVSTIYSA